MTNEALSVVEVLFGSIFRLFTSWYIPGTNVTPAVAGFALLFAGIVLRFLFKLLGIWGDDK